MRRVLNYLAFSLALTPLCIFASDFWSNDYYWYGESHVPSILGYSRTTGELVYQFPTTELFNGFVIHDGNIIYYNAAGISRIDLSNGLESIVHSWPSLANVRLKGITSGRVDQLFAFEFDAVYWLDPSTNELIDSFISPSIYQIHYEVNSESLWLINARNELTIVDVSGDGFGSYTTTSLDIQQGDSTSFSAIPSRNQILTKRGELYDINTGAFVDRLTEFSSQAHVEGESLYVYDERFGELVQFDKALNEVGRTAITSNSSHSVNFSGDSIGFVTQLDLTEATVTHIAYSDITAQSLFNPINPDDQWNITIAEWDGRSRFWSYYDDTKVLTEWDVETSTQIRAWKTTRDVAGLAYHSDSNAVYIVTTEGFLLKLNNEGLIQPIDLLRFSIDDLFLFESWLIAEKRSGNLAIEVVSLSGNVVEQTEDLSSYSVSHKDFASGVGEFVFHHSYYGVSGTEMLSVGIDSVTGLIQPPNTLLENPAMHSHLFSISPTALYFFVPGFYLHSMVYPTPIIESSFGGASPFIWINNDFYSVESDGYGSVVDSVITRRSAPIFTFPYRLNMRQKVLKLYSQSTSVLAILEADGVRTFEFFDTQNMPDIDEDGYHDYVDNCPNVPNPAQGNFDEDDFGDECDSDDDNDRIPDEVELAFGLSSHNSADADQDPDGDGYSNIEEYLYGGDLFDPEKKPIVINSFNYDFSKRHFGPLLSFSGADSVSYYDIEIDEGLDISENRLVINRGSSGEPYIEVSISGLFQKGNFYYKSEVHQGSSRAFVYMDGEYHSSQTIPRGEHTITVRWDYSCFSCTEGREFLQILIESIRFESVDMDDDSIDNHIDNCPGHPNKDQENSDGDMSGDLCDPWPNEYDDSTGEYSIFATHYWGDRDTDEDKVPDHAEFFLSTDLESKKSVPYRYKINSGLIGNDYLSSTVLYDWIIYDLPFYDDEEQEFAFTSVLPDSEMSLHLNFEKLVVLQFDLFFPSGNYESCEILEMYIDGSRITSWSGFEFERFNLMLLPGEHEVRFDFLAEELCTTVENNNVLYIYNVWLYSNSVLKITEPLPKVQEQTKKGGSFGSEIILYLLLFFMAVRHYHLKPSHSLKNQ
jgi:hypothetical protein